MEKKSIPIMKSPSSINQLRPCSDETGSSDSTLIESNMTDASPNTNESIKTPIDYNLIKHAIVLKPVWMDVAVTAILGKHHIPNVGQIGRVKKIRRETAPAELVLYKQPVLDQFNSSSWSKHHPESTLDDVANRVSDSRRSVPDDEMSHVSQLQHSDSSFPSKTWKRVRSHSERMDFPHFGSASPSPGGLYLLSHAAFDTSPNARRRNSSSKKSYPISSSSFSEHLKLEDVQKTISSLSATDASLLEQTFVSMGHKIPSVTTIQSLAYMVGVDWMILHSWFLEKMNENIRSELAPQLGVDSSKKEISVAEESVAESLAASSYACALMDMSRSVTDKSFQGEIPTTRLSSNKNNIPTEALQVNHKPASRQKQMDSKRKKSIPSSESKLPHHLIFPQAIPPYADVHVQTKQCMHNMFSSYEKCRSCVRKSGESCRFKLFRCFVFDENNSLSYGPYFIGSDEDVAIQAEEDFLVSQRQGKMKGLDSPTVDTASFFDVHSDLLPVLIDSTREQMKSLLCRELTLIHDENAIYRPPVNDTLPMCDACNHTIFNCHWMCSICGAITCLDCYNAWDDSSDLRTLPKQQQLKNGTIHKAAICSYRRIHKKSQMILVHQLPKESIQQIQRELSKKNIISKSLPSRFDRLEPWRHGDPMLLPNIGPTRLPSINRKALISSIQSAEITVLNCSNQKTSVLGSDDLVTQFFNPVHSVEHRNEASRKTVKYASDIALRVSEDRPQDFNDLLQPWEKDLIISQLIGPESALNLARFVQPGFLSYPILESLTVAQGSTHEDTFDSVGWTYSVTDCVFLPIHLQGAASVSWHVLSSKASSAIQSSLAIDGKLATYLPSHNGMNTLLNEHKHSVTRFSQRSSDIILIPAGCFWHASFESDTILLKLDFVSPFHYRVTLENMKKLHDSLGHPWDPEYVHSMLFHAWNHIIGQSRVQGPVVFKTRNK